MLLPVEPFFVSIEKRFRTKPIVHKQLPYGFLNARRNGLLTLLTIIKLAVGRETVHHLSTQFGIESPRYIVEDVRHTAGQQYLARRTIMHTCPSTLATGQCMGIQYVQIHLLSVPAGSKHLAPQTRCAQSASVPGQHADCIVCRSLICCSIHVVCILVAAKLAPLQPHCNPMLHTICDTRQQFFLQTFVYLEKNNEYCAGFQGFNSANSISTLHEYGF